MPRTKIVCTIGPATASIGKIESLIEAGMDVARLNFSHGVHSDHASVITMVRQASEKLGKPVAILQDLQGPKIRTGRMKDGSVTLQTGDEFTLTTNPVEGTSEKASTTYANLPKDVQEGDQILLDDGLIELKVLESSKVDVRCRVIDGGVLKDRKGINLPGISISSPSVTDKDKEDLKFGLDHGIDYVAISFVRWPEDVVEVKDLIRDARTSASKPQVIAKLEKPEAIDRLSEILDVSDGVMVARGDLGVEMSPEKVPLLQKRIIKEAAHKRVVVITATQMLESMMQNPRPTRAEASDVANAILDGTDAVMLSGETAAGAHPIQAVEMMSRIVNEVEAGSDLTFTSSAGSLEGRLSFPDTIGEVACHAAEDLGAAAIVAFTQSGSTARLISKYHPITPIIAFTPYPEIQRRASLYWGVNTRPMDLVEDTEDIFTRVEESLLAEKSVRPGDIIVIVCSSPIKDRVPANLLKLHTISKSGKT